MVGTGGSGASWRVLRLGNPQLATAAGPPHLMLSHGWYYQLLPLLWHACHVHVRVPDIFHRCCRSSASAVLSSVSSGDNCSMIWSDLDSFMPLILSIKNRYFRRTFTSTAGSLLHTDAIMADERLDGVRADAMLMTARPLSFICSPAAA